ncbi:MAG: hypothetical protein K0R68_2363 [Mycobacterium sp.]|nr:hypothetical protein [Mycobacterium sp.]
MPVDSDSGDSDYDDDGGPGETLSPSESLDSDEVRNDDGDIVADPPDRWIEPKEDETLDERLADEVPDVDADTPQDAEQERPARQTHGQIDGTPEDGDSFFEIVDEDDPDA